MSAPTRCAIEDQYVDRYDGLLKCRSGLEHATHSFWSMFWGGGWVVLLIVVALWIAYENRTLR